MDTTAASLVCPKCGATMRTYERSGMNVDQCTGCRGVFLDSGELERLVNAESSYYEARGYRPERHDDDDDEERWGGRRRRGRGGFLGGLFEGGDD
ncbi:MAG: zf-TFIIB domain-containing protein [Actinomycetota bacterium]|nr:zf-TFIIB domain-containing protein [Actinomycetota bacterium]